MAITMYRERSRGVMPAQHELLLAADPFDGRDHLLRIEAGIFLIDVAALNQMLGKQFLDMGRALERGASAEPAVTRATRISARLPPAFSAAFAAAISAARAFSYSRSMTARNSASLDLKW